MAALNLSSAEPFGFWLWFLALGSWLLVLSSWIPFMHGSLLPCSDQCYQRSSAVRSSSSQCFGGRFPPGFVNCHAQHIRHHNNGADLCRAHSRISHINDWINHDS